MVYLQIEEDEIPVGNFSFVYDHTKNEELFGKFYEAEKNLKVDYLDFAHKIRMAFEAFALDEESKKRKRQVEYLNMDISSIKEQIISEIKQPASLLNYKNIIIDLCADREQEFADMLLKYSFIRNTVCEDEVRRKLKAFIRFLYSFGSESSHANVLYEEKYNPNKENCLRVVGAFHDFLCIYYKESKKYDSTFYIFSIRGKYKPLLAKFDCTKDSADATFTVFQNIEKKIHNRNTNQFFAPEVIRANMGIGVDWKKADIYSLAKTILFIISGSITDNYECLDEIDDLNDNFKIVLMEMLDEKPENRPELTELINSL